MAIGLELKPYNFPAEVLSFFSFCEPSVTRPAFLFKATVDLRCLDGSLPYALTDSSGYDAILGFVMGDDGFSLQARRNGH
jgi:hypothetical protein